MAKYSGSYERIVLGVSQQVPQDRREGQHFEQINIISDPVRGLVRRRGSEFINDKLINQTNAMNMPLSEAYKYRTYDFVVGNNRYSLVYRVGKQPNSQSYKTQFCFCWDKENNKFVDVVFADGGDWNPNGSDPLVSKLRAKGSSSITNVGRYLYIAVKDHAPEYSTTNVWSAASNFSNAVIWVRNGGYSKTFKATLKIRRVSDNVRFDIVGEYKTLTSSYPGVLDTSDILTSDPDYQKKVNDRTNAYNTAVTQWIGTASADIMPDNIAQKIMEAMQQDRDDQLISNTDLFFELSNSSVGVKVNSSNYVIEELLTTDSGDETFIRGTANIVSSIDKLTAEHYPGKIVKIQAKRSDESDAYYMKAEPRTSVFSPGDMTEVTWVQTAGVVTSIGSAIVFATIEDGVLYVAGSASKLKSISGMTDEVPGFEDSTAGDLISSPPPYFLGRRIDFLGNFQDRLIIGSGSTLLFSRPGKYLNLFRQDALSVLDDDPIEIYPTGSEDDKIVSSVMYQKSMILFGERKQYMLNGNQALTPKNSLMPIVGAHEDTVDAHPVASGNFIFHTKFRNGFTTLHQLQGGYVADTPESHELSKQLSSYFKGKPLEIIPITTPDTVLIRTDADPNQLFVYNYLDTQDASQRILDSWSKWNWDIQLGSVCGLTYDQGDIVVFTMRPREVSGQVMYSIVADKFSMSADISDKPYLDSLMKYDDVVNPTNPDSWHTLDTEYSNRFIAFDDGVREKFLGQTWETRNALVNSYPTKIDSMWVGIGFDAFVTPTNPYIRDSKGKAIVNGRTIMSQFIISMADTGGVKFEVNPKGGQTVVKGDYNGRELSRSSAEVGIQPIAESAQIPFIVGMENNMFTYTIRARDWLPMTVVGITWVGQLFSNTRRT